ncbi:hypothetical protein [Collinsella bouchesdurhonensis]|uniref:hypothetical protein n=1 Tax=Collinsella bouchesdurhonensis TaxID=1907654 RepID=UPI00058DD92B|nr:hypothetical protein [Collinsella bouchesdurhonensis]
MRTTTKQKVKPHPVFERTGENSIRISALPNRADAQRMNLKRSYHAFMRALPATSAATNNPAPSEMWPQRPYAASV